MVPVLRERENTDMDESHQQPLQSSVATKDTKHGGPEQAESAEISFFSEENGFLPLFLFLH